MIFKGVIKVAKMFLEPNILNEGNQMEVLEYNDDEMEMIVRCNNCGLPIKYGKTRMISGFVGCDNKIKIDGKEVECYFGDLMPRVMDYKENHNDFYRTGKVYRWRDNVDGGIKNASK